VGKGCENRVFRNTCHNIGCFKNTSISQKNPKKWCKVDAWKCSKTTINLANDYDAVISACVCRKKTKI
jgi:hypothetical protein